MRKFLLSVLSIILFVCVVLAVACAGNNADYHLLTFRKTNGVTYVSKINSNKGFSNGVWEVKDGVTVTFTLELASDAEGEPLVYFNDEVITANESKVYSVKVTADAEITVDGIEASGDYNRLVITPTAGVAVKLITVSDDGETLKNGMMVRSGTEVSFSVEIADGFYGTPVVYANKTVLTEKDKVYSFVMSEPTTITVDGIKKNISLNFNKGDTRVDYIGTDGFYFDTDTALPGEYGEEIVFDVKISVYYDISLGYEVQANTTIITPQADGHYHITLEEDTTVFVSGLEQEKAFTARGEGNGTKSNPFKLSRPIDLYEMAMRINDAWYTGAYGDLYYELTADIDFDGEQLFVIGDGSSSYAYFSGHFNGNGHTISNYYITDTRIEQSEFSQLFLSNVGMFGFVMPGLDSAPVIENLKLDSFTISANASRTSVDLEDYALCVGSLAGATFGTSVTNVSATNGRIIVTGGKNSGAYVGGLIGQQFSEYGLDEGTAKFDSCVSFCMTDVYISVTADNNSYVFATGGISGALIVGDEHYTAYVLNCYSAGDIEGGQNAGGIVGYAYNHTAVVNCYSSGDVRAISSLSEGYLESVYYATAGGIVGYAEYSTVIADSFSTGYISAQSSRTNAKYRRISGTVAAMDDNSALHDADAIVPTLINLHGGVKNINSDFIFGTLGWNESDWQLSDGLPVLKTAKAPSISVQFSVNAQFGNISPVTLKSYKSLAGWDKEEGEISIPEFVQGKDGNRSYGYFFDSELTKKVPRSFVITSDITLYVGYANYAEIAGVYYLDESITLELSADGICIYREGALNQTTVYSWDGETLVVYYSAVGVLSDIDVDSSLIDYYFGSYYIFRGTIEEGVLSIYGGAVEEIGSDGYYTGEIIYLFPDNSPLKGYKQVASFKYGSYYFDDGEYIFFGNRTGKLVSGKDEKTFSYAFSAENELTLTYLDGTKATATLKDGYVTNVGSNSVQVFDKFTGEWEKSFQSDKKYTFDGKGNWTYSGHGATSSGTYTVSEGMLADSLGAFTAKFAGEFLEITVGSIKDTYYKQGSFKGEWYYNGVTAEGSDIAVGVTFDGIGTSGYGTAHVVYSTGTAYELTYEYSVENNTKYILLFYHDSVFGQLVYNSNNLTLSGTLNGHKARFTVYDALLGRWVSDDSDITSAEFNGNGFYDLVGDRATGAVSVRGTVRINGLQRVNYILDRESLVGSFTYNSVKYTIAYDEDARSIEVTGNNRTFYLVLPDSWYGRELIDSDGTVYSFDGKSNLPSGGKITVSDGSSYAYTIVGDTVVLTGGATLTLGQNGRVYVLSADGTTKNLTLNTPFTGSWIIGGLGGRLSIGEVYADNTASGSYTLYKQTAKTVSLTYNPEGGYLTYTEDGLVFRITATAVGGSYQLTFGSVSGNRKCIPVQSADGLQGKEYYVLNDSGEKDGRSLVFDGLGEYAYANGSAVLLNSLGGIEKSLIYGKNSYGDWIIVSNYYDYVLVSCKKDTKFDEIVLYRLEDGEGNYFAIVSPDGLYEYNVKDASDSSAYYIFNGCGKVKYVSSSGEVVYAYKIIELDGTTFKHKLEFTAEDGTSFNVILDLSSSSQDDWNISKAQ